ncbi:MAG: hypothetical protein WDZ68_02175 [Candidatus Paceibacterota bacterium]
MLEKNISSLFGFEELSEEQKAELLNDVGMTIIESTSLRFVTEIDEAETARFEEILTKNAETDEMLKTIIETFPRFAEILEEEITAFKTEAAAVLETE